MINSSSGLQSFSGLRSFSGLKSFSGVGKGPAYGPNVSPINALASSNGAIISYDSGTEIFSLSSDGTSASILRPRALFTSTTTGTYLTSIEFLTLSGDARFNFNKDSTAGGYIYKNEIAALGVLEFEEAGYDVNASFTIDGTRIFTATVKISIRKNLDAP